MKIAYDVPIPYGQENGKYIKVFDEFLMSDHKTMSIEFETKDEAIKCTISILNAMNRRQIYGIRQKRNAKVVYWEKAVTECTDR